MGLLASESGGGNFELTPEGVYTARCYRIIDLGTQESNNPTYKPAHKVMISWELIGKDDPRMEDGRPFSIHQKYTVSLSEKATLRQHLEAWRGRKFTPEELKGFDLKNVMGAYCTIQVVHSEDGKFANVNSIMAYRGDKLMPVNTDVIFDIDEPDMDVFEGLSDNMKANIMLAPEWKGSTKPIESAQSTAQDEVAAVTGDEEVDLDSIPF